MNKKNKFQKTSKTKNTKYCNSSFWEYVSFDLYFEDSLTPQFWVDKNLILRGYNNTMSKTFQLNTAVLFKNVKNLAEKINDKSLTENIRGVLLTERTCSKIKKLNKTSWFTITIQPCFSKTEEEITGAIITYIENKR